MSVPVMKTLTAKDCERILHRNSFVRNLTSIVELIVIGCEQTKCLVQLSRNAQKSLSVRLITC